MLDPISSVPGLELCKQQACTEVRAANLSGECRWLQELQRGNWQRIASQHQVCVKRRTLLSLRKNPACSKCIELEKIVDEVFKSCFNDTAPFIDIP